MVAQAQRAVAGFPRLRPLVQQFSPQCTLQLCRSARWPRPQMWPSVKAIVLWVVASTSPGKDTHPAKTPSFLATSGQTNACQAATRKSLVPGCPHRPDGCLRLHNSAWRFSLRRQNHYTTIQAETQEGFSASSTHARPLAYLCLGHRYRQAWKVETANLSPLVDGGVGLLRAFGHTQLEKLARVTACSQGVEGASACSPTRPETVQKKV